MIADVIAVIIAIVRMVSPIEIGVFIIRVNIAVDKIIDIEM
jgi:hypothetical protein